MSSTSTEARIKRADLIIRSKGSVPLAEDLVDLLATTTAIDTLASLIESPLSAEELEAAERVSEVKMELQRSLMLHDSRVTSNLDTYASDLEVKGPLSVIVEWARDWRSEIEELG